MEKPLEPSNEHARLNALLNTALLDSEPEKRFDRITLLAKAALNIPMVMVTLVDAKRQWFKSKQGVSVTETSRDVSFCAHTILDSDVFQVSDASKDKRFFDNPLVTGSPFIRFYAGVPLLTYDGFAIGTLCIMDITPRELTTSELTLLRNLAEMVEAEINQIDRRQEFEKFKSIQELSEVIVKTQSSFIKNKNRVRAFDILLTDILALTDSEYGFIGDVLFTPDKKPYLKAYSITDISWNEETKALYDKAASEGLEFRNLESLFGAALKTGCPVISNDPSNDHRSGGLPPGHPELNCFLGIPIYFEKNLIGMVGVANKKHGYDNKLISYLKPLLQAIGQVMVASTQQLELEVKNKKLSYLSEVANQTTNAVVITDLAGKIEWVNEGFNRQTGYTLNEVKGLKPGQILQGPETDQSTVEVMHMALAKRQSFEVEVLNYSKNGDSYWVRIFCNPLKDDHDDIKGFIAIETNIDAQKFNEKKLKESSDLQNTILSTIIEGVVTTDQSGIIKTSNPALREIFGYSEKELIGENIKILMPKVFADSHENYMHEYRLKDKNAQSNQIMGKLRSLSAKRSNGETFPVEVGVQKVDYNGEVLYVGSIRDITIFKQQQDEIEKLAYFDPLTNLANRRLFREHINRCLKSETLSFHCLLFIDVDNFKKINDVLGHSAGDELLIEVGKILKGSIGSGCDIAARLGGDEFSVLLDLNCENESEAVIKINKAADYIINKLKKPLYVDRKKVNVSLSIGGCIFCGNQFDIDTMTKQADIAMHESKIKGKNRFTLFNYELEFKLAERFDIEENLRTAITEEKISVYYQPVVDKNSNIVKLEALVRWKHPIKGWIRPDVFIEIAETYQLIIPLGNLILNKVLRDLSNWTSSYSNMNWNVAINISQLQLSSPYFQAEMERALKRSFVNSHQIILEITESTLASDIESNIITMNNLKKLGLRFSLDDFGTGYSSLSYLKKLPIDELKIDKSFVDGLPHSTEDIIIIKSIVSLAKAMSLNVVAEGVETREQFECLEALGCDLFQGYYFFKPMPRIEIENILK